MFNILCIEDSQEVQIVIRAAISTDNCVTFAASISEARDELGKNVFDAVILDLGLPDGDGLIFCAELKSNAACSTLPVFILTGKNSIMEKSLGFQLGIEDYIIKPFNPIELNLRIESRLKKLAAQKSKTDIISIGPLVVNFSSQRVSLKDSESICFIDFSSTEFKILSFLIKNKDQVKSREQIISAAWSDGIHLSDRTVDSHISRIRKKLVKGPCVIEAVVGSGYRLSTKKATALAA